jgi:signal recognition particle subunit SRP54
MGSVSGIFSMLPGVPKDLKEVSASIDDRQIDQVEAIIHSMTPAERVDPAVIDGSRRVRIANGSGTATSDVNALLKQFKEMRKMMKGIGRGGGKGGMAGALGGLGGMLGRGPKLSPGALDELAEMGAAGDMAGFPGSAELAGATGPAAGGAAVGSGAANGGATRGSSKSRGKGKKKGKGGGRVTPKAR